ncbi:MAG: family 78 glycoside hydrolase catalytic domain, partial [Clostridiales bacterium]|nr:family 78 glycoside hydrolase catalytic domain [Clostridiales bacterium]
RLNGERVGNFVLAPGHTDYRKRIQYQTYDVTPLMHSGTNTLTVAVADGWYRGSVGAWGLRNQYGKETKLLVQLELTLSDGSIRTVCTDGTWNWSGDGPVRFADNKDGERIDANKEPTYAGKAKETFCAVVPSASNNVYITEHETFKPTKITTPAGKTVLDFGCNIAGYLSFSLNAESGDKIKLRFGEMLDSNGEFTQKNIQCATKKRATPLQQVVYACKNGRNCYKTRFAIFGFRYVLVEADTAVNPDDFTAIAVYSDMRTVMKFDSSNELLNRFVRATLMSAKNNSADVPTDCPTRERHGWTGDIQIFFGTATYLLDYASFAKKYLRDVFDWQKKDGRLPQIAPYGGVDFYMWVMNGSVGWSDVGILMPWRFYKIYGDRDILKTYYSRMQQYAGFMIKRIGKWLSPMIVYTKPTHVRGKTGKYIVNYGQSYGEWAEPADVHAMKWTDMVSPHPEVSTAYTSYVLGVMADISETLGKDDDAEYYRGISEKCRESYQAL